MSAVFYPFFAAVLHVGGEQTYITWNCSLVLCFQYYVATLEPALVRAFVKPIFINNLGLIRS